MNSLERIMSLLVRCAVLGAVMIFAWPAVASADWCEGRKPVEHDDGRYHFSSESWVRQKYNVVFYGRCIKVLPPTNKLRNHWVGVLPNATARKGRPTTGGVSYIVKQSESREADLWYGNADDELKATYIAHQDEATGTGDDSEARDSSYRSEINSAIKELRAFVLESIFSFSFEAKEGIESSLTDFDVRFASTFDGKTFAYEVNYSLTPLSKDYSNEVFSIGFGGQSLINFVKQNKEKDVMAVTYGKDKFTFDTYAPGEADFVSNTMLLLDDKGNVITIIPITYVLPVQ